MTCLCKGCSPNYKFNSMECMFCHKGLQGEGKLKSSNGARVCQGCMKSAAEVLDKDSVKEKLV
jgi:hypothetical protein